MKPGIDPRIVRGLLISLPISLAIWALLLLIAFAHAQELSPSQIAVQVTKGVGLLSELADNQLHAIQALTKERDELKKRVADLQQQLAAAKSDEPDRK